MDHFGEDSSKITRDRDYRTRLRKALAGLVASSGDLAGYCRGRYATEADVLARGLVQRVEERRREAALVLLQTSDEQLTITTASELSRQEKLNALRAGLADLVRRFERILPPWAGCECGCEIAEQTAELHKLHEDFQRLLVTGGVA